MRALRIVLIFVLIIALGAVYVGWDMLSHGFSARLSPNRVESFVAPRLRNLGIPSKAHNAKNPIADSPDTFAEAMAHFADHCAVCHGSDGSGETRIGKGLFPKPPDLRENRTQDLTDGELYYIIDNGVRLTGMPGWGGDPEHGPEANWNLVQFIRHLPQLTPAEAAHMRDLNPKAPDEDHEGREGHEGGDHHDEFTHTNPEIDVHAMGEVHEHPTWKQYKWVAIILTVITVVEVWAYYVPSFVASPAFVPVRRRSASSPTGARR